MFEAVCDCCGKRGGLHHYMLRMEGIENPSVSLKDDFRESEVIPRDCRIQSRLKLLLCSECYNKTGLPLFNFEDYKFRGKLLHDNIGVKSIDSNKTLVRLDPLECKNMYPFPAIYKDNRDDICIVNVIGYSSTVPGFIIEGSNPDLDTHWFAKNLYVYKEDNYGIMEQSSSI